MMKAQPLPAQPPGLSLGDVYYLVFRHKWKIAVCSIVSMAAALAVYKLDPPPYESEAKLFVRYVLGDKALGPAASDAASKSPDQGGETIMNSEKEIVTSIDVSRQVAEAVGPEKILAPFGGGNDITAATVAVRGHLTVSVPPFSSVMHIVFRHPDPAVVQPVLREVVERYLKLHVETHTANGMLGDFLTQETDQLRARLLQTEEELRKATSKAGVITVDDAKKSYTEQISAIRKELYDTEADLAEKTTAYQDVSKRVPSTAAAAESFEPIPPEILGEYRSTTTQYELLARMEQEVLTQFTPENPRVVEIHGQMVKADEQRRKLQQRYPRLTQIGNTTERGPSQDVAMVNALATQSTALKAKIAVLTSQMNALRGEVTKLEQMEGTIVELRRKKDLEEANYRYYAASLEQARINETLGNGRVSNIIQIQKPSPPSRDSTKLNRLIGLILGGGLLFGFAWAFSIESYFDRTVRRPIDVERTLGATLLLSIPVLRKRELLPPKGHVNGHDGANASAPASNSLAIYHDTLRDRIIAYFESIGLNHKPKLVTVTGVASKSGVTTTAAGLARSLSETGEGNVLYVDMNVGAGVAQQFTNGKAVCGLDDVLLAPADAHVQQNLYVVREGAPTERLSRNMPRRFTDLVPKLKASDFDYIIFDMPPVSQISVTPRLAGFMDFVLLVVESERSDREVVQRAARLLANSREHVGVVLNKTRNYVPRHLDQEALAF